MSQVENMFGIKLKFILVSMNFIAPVCVKCILFQIQKINGIQFSNEVLLHNKIGILIICTN